MPKYQVTSPEGVVYEITAPDGATEAEVLEYAKSQMAPKAKKPSAVRDFGIGTRGVAQGVAAIPLMVGDATNTAVNYGIQGANKLFGTDFDYIPMASQSFEGVLDQTGLPTPQNDREAMIAAINRGGASVVAPAGVAKTAGGLLTPLGQKVGTQILAGGSAGASSEYAREQGAGPYGQMAAGILGGIVGGVTPTLANKTVTVPLKAAGRVASGFTRSGQERAVGNTLNQTATDRTRAMHNMADWERVDGQLTPKPQPDIVPGSRPTTGPASKDYGLISLERAMKSKNPEAFAIRYSQQNAARQRLVDSISKTQKEYNAAIEARDSVTTPMRDAAFANKQQANPQPVLDLIEKIATGPKGKRAPVQQAMATLRKQVKDTTDPEALYAIRQDIGDMLGGKYSGPKANLKLASSQLIEVRNAIDDAIEKAAPGFKGYLEKYKELSKPINQMEMATEAQSKSAYAAPDITGEDILTQAKWNRALDKIKQDKLNPFTPEQMRKMEAVAKDLDRGSVLNNSMIRPQGSDTAQNLNVANRNVANVVGMMMNGNGGVWENLKATAVLRPLKWVMQSSQEQMDNLIVEALLDPKTAAMLMKKATPKNVEAFSQRLKDLGTAATIGSALGQQAPDQQQNRYSQSESQ